MLKKYKEYIKDNPNHLWFKRKHYGWGWTPVTKEGWLVVLVYVVLGTLLVRNLNESLDNRHVLLNFGAIILMTAVLILICYKKGEKPRWQWGFPKRKD